MNSGEIVWQEPVGERPEVRSDPALAGVALPAPAGRRGAPGSLCHGGGPRLPDGRVGCAVRLRRGERRGAVGGAASRARLCQPHDLPDAWRAPTRGHRDGRGRGAQCSWRSGCRSRSMHGPTPAPPTPASPARPATPTRSLTPWGLPAPVLVAALLLGCGGGDSPTGPQVATVDVVPDEALIVGVGGRGRLLGGRARRQRPDRLRTPSGPSTIRLSRRSCPADLRPASRTGSRPSPRRSAGRAVPRAWKSMSRRGSPVTSRGQSYFGRNEYVEYIPANSRWSCPPPTAGRSIRVRFRPGPTASRQATGTRSNSRSRSARRLLLSPARRLTSSSRTFTAAGSTQPRDRRGRPGEPLRRAGMGGFPGLDRIRPLRRRGRVREGHVLRHPRSRPRHRPPRTGVPAHHGRTQPARRQPQLTR